VRPLQDGARPGPALYAVRVTLLPYQKLTLRTDSPLEAVSARLSAMVAEPRLFLWKSPSEPFLGKVRGNHFKLTPVPRNRRGSQLVIVGDLVRVPSGTELRLVFRLQASTIVFGVVWFGGLLAVGALLLRAGLQRGFGSTPGRGSFGTGIAFIGGMVLFGYAIVSVAFWSGVRSARTVLRDGLGCQEAGAAPRRLVR